MARQRKNELRKVSSHELFEAAGEGIWNAQQEFQRYFEIKKAGGHPEVYFSRAGGYSVIDSLEQSIRENHARHSY
jgi:hypothetical protein